MSRRIAGRVAALGAALALVACGSHAAATPSTAAAPSGAASPAAAAPDRDWTQFGYDAVRNSVAPASGINAGNLHRLRTRVVHLDGTVDSTAIQLHAVRVDGRVRDVAVVTTTYGRTIAFDPGTGQRLWEFTPAAISDWEGSAQFTTSSPIADPDRAFVYATSPDGLIHKLRVSDGRQVRGPHWPVRVTFDPVHEKLASPLGIEGESLIAVTDGYFGDQPNYQGHVVTIDRTSGRITHVFNSLCSNVHHLIDPTSSCPESDSAIWGRAGAVIEPGTGRILVATGNGHFDGRRYWGDSVLELSPHLALLHNWTPGDQGQLDSTDTDLGSTSPVFLGKFGGYRLVAQGGKSGQIALLNLDRLNGTRGPAGPRTGGELGVYPAPGPTDVFTAAAVWRHGGHVDMFVSTGGGTIDYRLVDPAHPKLRQMWARGIAGTSPMLAGGLLYVYNPGGALEVYDPGSGRLLDSLPAQPGHWNSPIAVGGRVILPVGDANEHAASGSVLIYHLPGR